jgi:organic radical activating enzyme
VYLLKRILSDTGTWAIGLTGRSRTRSTDLLTAIVLAPVCFVRVLFGRAFARARGKADIPYIDCVVTTKCTLRCRKCANLMQYYESPDTPQATQIITDLADLLKDVHFIRCVGLLGGEPLLAPGLDEIVNFLAADRRVGSIQIITNGTLLPGPSLLSALCCKKVSVVISDYGASSNRLDELTALLSQNGIRFTALRALRWRDYGEPVPHGRTDRVLCRIMGNCRAMHCRTLLNGELHLCPRSAHGKNLGLFNASGDFVDIRNGSPENARKIEYLLHKKRRIEACDYCNNSSVLPSHSIPPAEQ